MGAATSGYPRPDFERSALHFESLDGPWDFIFDDKDEGSGSGWHMNGLPTHASSDGDGKPNAKRTIQVPFVFQCPASGINERGVHQVLWYERLVEDLRGPEEKDATYRLLLRFGAVDYHAKVYLDGHFVGEHRGGHVPFDLDISDVANLSLSRPHRLVVRVFDSAFDLSQPRGKQTIGPEPESIFYTPSSGIWQSVWIESVPPTRIADSSHGTILRSNDIERGILDARIAVLGRRVGQAFAVEVEASIGGVKISSERRDLPGHEDFAQFDVNMRLSHEQIDKLPEAVWQSAPLNDDNIWRDGVALWSPEHPVIYDLRIRLLDSTGRMVDEIKTETGMRSLNWTTGDGTFRLNGRPYFHALVLDQGYWPETLMTPPTADACKVDIQLAKNMGFNGCRKHQKVEDPAFMYWANHLGFLVWGEMANCFHFNLEAVDRFNQEWMEMIGRDINHPSLVALSPTNESWGYGDLAGSTMQRNHIRSLYYLTKTLDPTRPINDNCGWEHVITDLVSFHEYDEQGMADRCASLREILHRGRPMFVGPIYSHSAIEDEGSKHRPGAPILCTEFGGISMAASNDPSRREAWGYGANAADGQDLVKRIRELIMATVKEGHVCGIVWTQFTDIETEQNGLYTYDRKEKLPANEVKAILQDAAAMYFAKRHSR